LTGGVFFFLLLFFLRDRFACFPKSIFAQETEDAGTFAWIVYKALQRYMVAAFFIQAKQSRIVVQDMMTMPMKKKEF